MSQFESVKALPPQQFVRHVGIPLSQFLSLCQQISEIEAQERRAWPMKNRGLSSQKLTLYDKVLLTFLYLRHYPTFEQLGARFGISESYACKIYHRYQTRLVRLLRLPARKALWSPELEAVVLDVTEQPIERPLRKQRRYYSGKKNAIRSRPN